MTKSKLACLALLCIVPLACASHASGSVSAGGAASTLGDTSLFVPALANPPRAGDQTSELTLVALTLRQTGASVALFSAVRNDSATPSCQAGMLTDFFDQSGAALGSAGMTLQSAHFYRANAGDAATVPLSCIAPGEVALGASVDSSVSLELATIASLDHAFPAFIVDDLTETAGVSVSDLRAVTTAAGSAYSGTLTNDSSVTASAASVGIFSLNEVGRPLGSVTLEAPSALAPGESWSFQTDALDFSAASTVAYPTATFSN